MKFPSLSSTLNLLSPLGGNRAGKHLRSKNEPVMSSYDRIEEFVSIANVDANGTDTVMKFHYLNQVLQQLTVVTLIEHNMIDTLRVLLLSNYDVNYLIRGQTPLHFAIKDSNRAITSLLIDHGANLELKDRHQETALNAAVREGNVDIVKLLLEKGSVVKTFGSDLFTPLELAIHQEDIESIYLLEKYGAVLE